MAGPDLMRPDLMPGPGWTKNGWPRFAGFATAPQKWHSVPSFLFASVARILQGRFRGDLEFVQSDDMLCQLFSKSTTN